MKILELVYQQLVNWSKNKNLAIVIYNPELNTVSFPVYTVVGERRKIPDHIAANGIFEYTLRSKSPFLFVTVSKRALQRS